MLYVNENSIYVIAKLKSERSRLNDYTQTDKLFRLKKYTQKEENVN